MTKISSITVNHFVLEYICSSLVKTEYTGDDCNEAAT